MKRLHLGCGKRDVGRGWTNVDIAAFPHVHYVHDIATLPMFDDNSFDVVHSSHALTYVDRFEAVGVLTE